MTKWCACISILGHSKNSQLRTNRFCCNSQSNFSYNSTTIDEFRFDDLPLFITRTHLVPDLRIRRATAKDLPSVTDLLKEYNLPTEGVPDHIANYLISESSGEMIGTIGLEVYESTGLLRSACVKERFQSRGVGQRFYEILITYAQEIGVDEVVLLTTTAKNYFARKGFEVIDRESVTGSVLNSSEFRGACPTTATVMIKRLV